MTNLLDLVRQEIEEQSHRSWSCSARTYFLEFLFALVKVYESPEANANSIISGSSALADKVVLYLNSNYTKKITIQELCSMFSTNKTTLQAQFRNATGRSVMDYLISLRVKLAVLMIRDTSLAISEIAERTGFSDSTHLNKAFHKSTGYSPTQFRKQFRAPR